MTDGDVGPVMPDQADAIADRDFLLRALAALPPRQRAALVLRYYSDMPDAEIADALSCSVGTVRSQISRGLAQIRAASAEAAPHAAGQTGGRADGR
jgi:RNA polymerase sigma factor (sigma-70 family)